MYGYKATVVGENFEFMIDDEVQLLDFSSEVFVNAADESAAQQTALAVVRDELLAQTIWNDDSNQFITIDEIIRTDDPVDKAHTADIIWFFPEEDLFDEEE